MQSKTRKCSRATKQPIKDNHHPSSNRQNPIISVNSALARRCVSHSFVHSLAHFIINFRGEEPEFSYFRRRSSRHGLITRRLPAGSETENRAIVAEGLGGLRFNSAGVLGFFLKRTAAVKPLGCFVTIALSICPLL